MQSSRRIYSIFGLVFILLGVTGINITGAATKYTLPGQPTNLKAVGGLNSATLTWKAPASNGGKAITSYKVVFYPGTQVHICRSSSVRCVVDIANPNKPSAKPTPMSYYFTVAATNSVGTGPASGKTPYVLVKFRATIYIAPKAGPATPTPSPSATAVPSPTPDSSPTFTPPYVTNAFDGSYVGNATVTTKSALSPNGATSTIPTSFVIYAGRGTGRALNWSIDGYITDPAGQASVTVADSMYGSMTFAVSFTQDPTTKAISGNGHGTKTFDVVGYGDVTVDFIFSVTNKK